VCSKGEEEALVVLKSDSFRNLQQVTWGLGNNQVAQETNLVDGVGTLHNSWESAGQGRGDPVANTPLGFWLYVVEIETRWLALDLAILATEGRSQIENLDSMIAKRYYKSQHRLGLGLSDRLLSIA